MPLTSSNFDLCVQAFGAVLEAKAVNLYFADFKSSGSNYDKIPDVVGLLAPECLHVPYWLCYLLSQFT
jgi:hypothetical protein